MKHKYDYKIIESNNYDKLVEQVTEHLNTGWKLAGGAHVIAASAQYYFQTLYKEEVVHDSPVSEDLSE